VKDLNPLDYSIMLRRVRTPSAPSSEEVWQQLRQHHAEIPAHLKAQRTQAILASLEPSAQVEQHEPSSRGTLPHLPCSTQTSTWIPGMASRSSSSCLPPRSVASLLGQSMSTIFAWCHTSTLVKLEKWQVMAPRELALLYSECDQTFECV
jgi:hypothetical protein